MKACCSGRSPLTPAGSQITRRRLLCSQHCAAQSFCSIARDRPLGPSGTGPTLRPTRCTATAQRANSASNSRRSASSVWGSGASGSTGWPCMRSSVAICSRTSCRSRPQWAKNTAGLVLGAAATGAAAPVRTSAGADSAVAATKPAGAAAARSCCRLCATDQARRLMRLRNSCRASSPKAGSSSRGAPLASSKNSKPSIARITSGKGRAGSSGVFTTLNTRLLLPSVVLPPRSTASQNSRSSRVHHSERK